MRGGNHTFVTEQNVLFGGFNFKHIQGGTSHVAAVQRLFQIPLMHNPAAGTVDDKDTLFGFGQSLFVQQVLGFVIQGGVDRDKIGAAQQGVQIGLFDMQLNGPLLR